MPKEQGYAHGVAPGIELLNLCTQSGISEISIFGFTKDNVRRSPVQRRAFSRACVEFAREAVAAGAALTIVGDTTLKVFPPELRDWPSAKTKGRKVNLLVNYNWR
jgi:undecaprenyl diphosphate synthase